MKNAVISCGSLGGFLLALLSLSPAAHADANILDVSRGVPNTISCGQNFYMNLTNISYISCYTAYGAADGGVELTTEILTTKCQAAAVAAGFPTGTIQVTSNGYAPGPQQCTTYGNFLTGYSYFYQHTRTATCTCTGVQKPPPIGNGGGINGVTL